MIFSVWDPYARTFNYYEAPGTSVNYGARGTKYRPLNGQPQGPGGLGGGRGGIGLIGYAPESLALPLPSNARHVGQGDQARGVVAQSRGGVGEIVTVPFVQTSQTTAVGFLSGFGDVGEGEVPPPPPVTPPAPGISFGQIVVASCIAAVVGVGVQRLLNTNTRRRRRR